MNFKCLFKTQHTYVDFTNGSLPVLWNFKLANDVAVVWPAVLGGHLCGIYLKPTHTYTIHARSYKNHIQSFSWFFLITVTSSPLAMGFTARTIIVPSLVCKNHDVKKGSPKCHHHHCQSNINTSTPTPTPSKKKPDQIDQTGGVTMLQQQ